MTWRDGVHLTGTSIWCDARRRRDVCFVSSADKVGKTGHGQLIASPLTLALLGGNDGNLGVPLRQRFTLGTLRLELIASGRGPGAAALFVQSVEGSGKKLLYAGPVRPGPCGRAQVAVADVRACDTLVVEAPFGASKKKFPALDDVIEKVLGWTRKQLAAARRPILLVDSALDGLEVACVLAAEGIDLAAAKPIREAATRMASLDQTAMRKRTTNGMSGRSAMAAPVISAPTKELRTTIWLAAHRDAPKVITDQAHGTALLAGRPIDPSSATEVHFAWSHAADRTGLLEWIEETRATQVFVTGASAEAIVKALGERGKFLGPPQQMSLFAEVA